MKQVNGPVGIGGWLLVLCILLLIWQPLSLGLLASGVLNDLALRGVPLALVLSLRVLVTAFGIAAGLALLNRRPAAVTMAKASLIVSAATDVFVYLTPYFPSNRMPGETPFYIAASLAYYAIWLAYLFRAKRVKNTFGGP
ncbi:MAG TPA: hypothetical protein VG222_16035 [Vicinamibacterales bacterium]|jgi:hypothetical protein|nr:hypothetical protein [Vicinamibacterales bacterium]